MGMFKDWDTKLTIWPEINEQGPIETRVLKIMTKFGDNVMLGKSMTPFVGSIPTRCCSSSSSRVQLVNMLDYKSR